MKNLDDLLTIAQEAVEIGYQLMTTSGPGQVHQKGDRDLVTDLDLQIQHKIRTYLEKVTPDVDFLGEEQGGGVLDQTTDYVWALDPIDGTSNFARGIPLCATQLALIHRGEPLVAVIVAGALAVVIGVRHYNARLPERRAQASHPIPEIRPQTDIGIDHGVSTRNFSRSS